MRTLLLIPLGITLAGCGGETTEPPISEVPVVRPASTDSLSLGLKTYALPDAQTGPVYVATHQGTTLVGGTSGLFELTSGEPTLIDAGAVTSLVTVDGVGVVVGQASGGVSVWNGSLVVSPLAETLNAMNISALETRGEQLWIGTDTELHLLDGGELFALDGVSNTAKLFAHGSLVVADRMAVRTEADGYSIQDLADESLAEVIVPAAGDRIFGLAAGALAERVEVEEGVSWYPVALSGDETDTGATDVRAIDVDPTTGAVWMVTDAELVRFEDGAVSTMPLPIVATDLSITADGAAWLNDGTSIVRAGGAVEPLTFAQDIAAFSAHNCERCHAPLGVGHPLDWVEEVDAIIDAIDQGRMPQDGQALVGGTVELIRRWKADGLLP